MAERISKTDKVFRYRHYLTWPEDQRWEIIDGVALSMTPAPSRIHQKILVELLTIFHNHLRGKTCEVYAAPFDVRLPLANERDEETSNVVQPDIIVVCDPSKLDEQGCNGSPDLVVEIISPSTLRRDLKEKFYLYEKAGVLEYWIVYPENETIVIHKLVDHKYGRPEVYSAEDRITTSIFNTLTINLSEIFVRHLPFRE